MHITKAQNMWFKKKILNSESHDLGLLSLYIFEGNVFIFQFLNDKIHNYVFF